MRPGAAHALDLEKDVFKSDALEEIARSLKRSAEQSSRRKSEPFRSAMPMLNFCIDRGRKKTCPRLGARRWKLRNGR